MNDPDPTTPPTVAATTPLREVLLDFWDRAGRPDARRMAAETNLAPGLFTSFLTSTMLRIDVTAVPSSGITDGPVRLTRSS